jgi:hypothetical protein
MFNQFNRFYLKKLIQEKDAFIQLQHFDIYSDKFENLWYGIFIDIFFIFYSQYLYKRIIVVFININKKLLLLYAHTISAICREKFNGTQISTDAILINWIFNLSYIVGNLFNNAISKRNWSKFNLFSK